MAASLQEIIHSFPSFYVPAYLNKPPTGELHLDLLLVVTMLACVPTIWLFWVKGRYVDVVAYSFGFWVAVIYHWLALSAHNGLASVKFLGVHGAAWRTVDILGANVLMARTLGHALNVDHPLIALVPNLALPATLVVLLALLPGMGISLASRVTAGICGLTIVLQLWQSGWELVHAARHHLLPPAPRVAGAVASIALALWSFALAALDSDRYWLWHSLWHVGMGLGYWWLYVHLLGAPSARGEAGPPSSAGRRQRKAASSSKGAPTCWAPSGPLGIPGEAGLQDLLQALRSWLPGAAPSPSAEPPTLRPRRRPAHAAGEAASAASGATPTTPARRGRQHEPSPASAQRGRSGSRGPGGRSRSRSRANKARPGTKKAPTDSASLQPRSSATAASAHAGGRA